MKRYNNIYEKIYNMDNLKLAHKNARKDKSFYKDVKMVDENPEYYLKQIQDMLINKTYDISKYSISIINDKGKQRELMKLPYYPDRIIQWAIMLQVEDIFMNTFCTHTCASMKDRGIRRASKLIKRYMRDKEGTKYCLKIDIKHFYPNIDRSILKQLLRRKFKDKDLLELLDKIIDSAPKDKGIPIGSYLSQFLGNFYLSYFDHWLKENKHMKYIVRYMDDVVILYHSKEFLQGLKLEMDEYLHDNLNVEIKDNWQVFPTNIRGIDFVGFRFFYGYTLLRKSTCKNFKKTMMFIKKYNFLDYSLWCSINSYKGWLMWCDSFRLKDKYINPLQSLVDNFYYKEIKRSNYDNTNKSARL